MKQLGIFAVLLLSSIVTTVIAIFLALQIISKISPAAGNWDLFKGFDWLAALLVAIIYGGIIGIILGLISSAFVLLWVNFRENGSLDLGAMIVFSFNIGLIWAAFHYLSSPSGYENQSVYEEFLVPVIVTAIGFLTALVPQLIVKRFFEL